MMNALGAMQRWFLDTVTHRAGVSPDGIDERIVPSDTLTSHQRLSIYQRSYYGRLLDCFRSCCPALLHTLGQEVFDRFALEYLEASPPSTYTLTDLTASFPQWLIATRPDDPAGAWPDFVIELATLELAIRQVYEGPGLEDLPPLKLTAGDALAPSPSLRLFDCRYPVHRYHAAVIRGARPQPPARARSFFAVSRRNYRVFVRDLSAGEYAALAQMDGRRSGHEIIGERGWLPEWIRNGYVTTVPGIPFRS